MVEKTQDELREEMIKKLQEQNAQYMTEVAIPGVVRPVQRDDQ